MSGSGPLRRRTTVAIAAAAAVGLAVTTASAVNAAPRDLSNHQKNRVAVQLLAFNDYHGHLEPDSGNDGSITFEGKAVATNGAAYLATHLKNLRRGNEHSLTVAAGDLIGGSTFTSGVFHDEPSVETLDKMRLDVSGVGNHEFDEGVTELLRMQNGGCHPIDGCFQQDAAGKDLRYPGANFTYLAANVVDKSGDTVLPATWVKKVGTEKIGFIGMTLEGTDTLVSPAGIVGYDFLDEVEAGNRAAKRLQKKQGVKAIVVLLHEGGFQTNGPYSGCTGIAGPIVDIAKRLAPKIDAVITGHTHSPYACTIEDPKGQPRKVTSAASFGRIVSEINLKIDTRTGDVVRKSVKAVNHLVTRDVPQDVEVRAIVDKWVAKATGPGNRVVGSVREDIRRSSSRGAESSLPNLIADAQKLSTGAQVAFMNPGGVRADLLVNNQTGGEAPGQITYREAYNVQPFSNIMQTFDMTGAQIEALLEQQWMAGRAGGEVLRFGISDGFTYSWSRTAPNGSKIDPASIKLNGVTVDPAASYRVAANNFIADGGDSFTAFVNGAPRTGGKIDLDALIDYFTANPNVGAPPAARSTPNA